MIKKKIGKCIDCNSERLVPLIAKRCQFHYWEYRQKTKGKKEPIMRKRIAPISEKMKQNKALYLVVRNEFLGSHKKCEAGLENCSHVSTEVHHKKGRGTHLLDVGTFIAVCRSCHNWIETHPKEAKELGLSQSRLTHETETN